MVHSTRNYKQFNFDPRNRPIDQRQFDVLRRSVESHNLLHLFPIVVDASMTVYDGQHRLKVAEALDLPVFYIFDDNVSVDHITVTTDAVAKWKPEDYLHRWCMEGKKDYLTLREFWHANRTHKGKTFLTLNMCRALCCYADKKVLERAFREGTYSCNDLHFAQSVAQALRDWSEYVEFFNHITFVNTISNLMANSHYSHQHMLSKLQYLSTKIVKCPDMDSYIAVIEEVYNYRVLTRNRVTLRKLNPGESTYRADRKRKGAAA